MQFVEHMSRQDYNKQTSFSPLRTPAAASFSPPLNVSMIWKRYSWVEAESRRTEPDW